MADAPEIDGAVYVASRRPLRVGEIATVKIERADEYDLHGSVVGFKLRLDLTNVKACASDQRSLRDVPC